MLQVSSGRLPTVDGKCSRGELRSIRRRTAGVVPRSPSSSGCRRRRQLRRRRSGGGGSGGGKRGERRLAADNGGWEEVLARVFPFLFLIFFLNSDGPHPQPAR